jgi:MFS transporter, AAHS family, 4-hydroxybenzoate transporter
MAIGWTSPTNDAQPRGSQNVTPPRNIDVAAEIERQSVGAFQLVLGSLLLLSMFVDGFEAQAPGYAAPEIIQAFRVPRSEMGVVFGAGNLGLMIGAAIFGIIGDRVGRKRALIWGCVILSAFSFATVYVHDIATLRLLRVGSGIGVGGVLPSVIALGTEFSPRRIQASVIWLLLIGYQAGASSGAAVSTFLFPYFGWSSMFAIGAILPAICAILLLLFLPESIRFLALSPATQDRALSLLRRMQRAIPDGPARLVLSEERKSGFRPLQLFAGSRATFTLLLWCAFTANLMELQFLVTWLPTILQSPTVSRGAAALASVLVQAGGMAGGLLLSRFLDKGGIRPIGIAFSAGIFIVSMIGFAGNSVPLLMLATFGAGCTILGGQTNLNAMSGRFYPTFIRSNGVGWANGVGRIGSILGPVIGGVLIGADIPVTRLFLVAALPPFCAALACFGLARAQNGAAETAGDLAVQPGI